MHRHPIPQTAPRLGPADLSAACAQFIGLTGPNQPDMLCPSVPGQTRSSAVLKRESGANPELPRSGKRKRTP